MGTHFFTSITASYLPKARVLAAGIRQHAKEATIHLVLNDAVPPWFDLASEPFDTLITPDRLSIPHLEPWLFSHNIVELCTAVKGPALRYLLDQPGCEQVIYLDPDIVVLSSFDKLLAEFANASILLTPHLTEPETQHSAIADNELSALQHGIYNLGFLGVKNSEEGRRFANWWSDRLQDFCFDDKARGLFMDQRWADLIPAYFPDTKILRNPGYNVATWNLTARSVTGTVEEGFQVNGQPLIFFHFSGLDSGSQAGMLARYGAAMPGLQQLRDWYLAECDRQGQIELSSVPWAYGSYSNGEPILEAHRRLYRETLSLAERFPHPFQTGNGASSFLDWCHLQVEPLPPPQPSFHEETTPAYRIFVIAAPADVPYLPSTLPLLLEGTANRTQVWLVAHPDLPAGVAPADLPTLFVDSIRYEDLAAAVLRDHADRDLLLIRAGAVPPPQWDLRLAWTAARHASCLAVSPIDRRTLDEPGTFAALDPNELDRLCYWFRPDSEIEAASFSTDCLYLRAAALHDVLPEPQSRRLATLSDRVPRFRYRTLEAPHICVSFRCPLNTTASAAPHLGGDRYAHLRANLGNYSNHAVPAEPQWITQALTGPTLHIMHSWGGGVEQWLTRFSEQDKTRTNLVLRSVGPRGEFGHELHLYRYGPSEPVLLQQWTLAPPIRATAITHPQYREVLNSIDGQFGIERVIISSLIGHSLDCLRFKAPAINVCHDYYPFCSAINITFGETCRSCEAPRLQACLEENPHSRFFPNVVRDEWLVLRSEWLRAVRETETIFVAPSPSVLANYSRLTPELAPAFRVIPHGGNSPGFQSLSDRNGHSPLRILMLGSLGLHKGLHLFESLLAELPEFGEVTLAGCFDYGDLFARNPRVRVLNSYGTNELPQVVAEAKPDVGLLLSVVPETFSFTLQEFQSMGVPPLATREGSFNDFIQEGVNGFLCDPDPACIVARLREFAADRSPLHQVRENLRGFHSRSVEAMVSDYADLTPVRYSARRYFNGPHAPKPIPERSLQLFWAEEGSDFSEGNSFTFAPYHLRRQTVCLPFLRCGRGLGRLRLDLGSAPGIVALFGLTLLDRTGEQIWCSENVESFLNAVVLNQAFPLSTEELCLTGNDPSLMIPLPADRLQKLSDGGELVVDFAAETTLSHAAQLHDLGEAGWNARREVAALQGELAEELKRVGHELSEFEFQIAAADDLADALQADRDRVISEKRLVENSLAQVNQHLVNVSNLLTKAHGDLQLSQNHSHNLSEQVNKLNEALRLSQEHSQNLSESIARLNQAIESTRESNNALQVQNESLQTSLSWKLTEPIRLVGRKLKSRGD